MVRKREKRVTDKGTKRGGGGWFCSTMIWFGKGFYRIIKKGGGLFPMTGKLSAVDNSNKMYWLS